MINLKKNSYLQVKNVLCEGTVVNGNLYLKENIKFDGELQGDITSEADVVIGAAATVNGNITAGNVIISGKVTGNISASGQFCLTKTGSLKGNIQAASLVVEDGAVLQGISESRVQPSAKKQDAGQTNA